MIFGVSEYISEELRAECAGVRQAQAEAGYEVDDAEYEKLLAFTVRKARMNEKDDGYVPLLLVDTIREHLISQAINAVSMMYMAIDKYSNISTQQKPKEVMANGR